MADEELRQQAVADVDVAGDPAVDKVALDEALYLACVDDPVEQGEAPEGQEHPRAVDAASDATVAGFGVGAEGGQVEGTQGGPEQPRGMLGRQAVLGDAKDERLALALRLPDARGRSVGHVRAYRLRTPKAIPP